MAERCKACCRKIKKKKKECPPTFDPSQLLHGLYVIFWKSGGHSLASVGSCNDGTRWMAPCNWIGTGTGPWTDWSGVLRVVKFE